MHGASGNHVDQAYDAPYWVSTTKYPPMAEENFLTFLFADPSVRYKQ